MKYSERAFVKILRKKKPPEVESRLLLFNWVFTNREFEVFEFERSMHEKYVFIMNFYIRRKKIFWNFHKLHADIFNSL